MLPRAVSWIVRAVVPADRADSVLADLEDDYLRNQSSTWLIRETLSLTAAYLGTRMTQWPRLLTALIRDAQMVRRGFRRGGAPLVTSAGLLAVGYAAVLLSAALAEQLLIRPVSTLHGADLRRVVAVDRQSRTLTRFSYPELQQIRDHVDGSADIAAVYLTPVVIRSNNADIQTMAEIVDGRYFALMGIQSVIGRILVASDDRLDAPPVAVVAEPFWRRRLGATPHVLGTTIELNGAAYMVVGVARTMGSSSFLGASVDAWVPLSHADPIVNPGWRSNVRERWFTIFVLPYLGEPALASRLALASDSLSRAHPDPWRERRLETADATVLIGSQRSAAGMLALILGGLATLIMLAAGANVTGVLIARAAAGQRTAAIHMAIGAGRGVVFRRHLLEGACLGFGAGLLALLLYTWARAQLAEVTLLPTLALRLDLSLSGSMMVMTLAGGSMLGMMLAITPALWSTRVDLAQSLRSGDGRIGAALLVAWSRRALVSAQVCVSLVLLVGATLFVRSLNTLVHADLGFPRERLVAMDFDLEPVMRSENGMPPLGRQALARISSLTQVESAAMSNRAPVDASTPTVEVRLPGDVLPAASDVTMYLATDGYFATVGVPITLGRAFSEGESLANADVVIVNQSLATRLWPGESPLDRALRVSSDDRLRRVVGVARDARYRTLTELGTPHVYLPTPPGLGLTLLARVNGDPREAMRAIQTELNSIGPGVVGFFPRTLDDHLAIQLLPTRAVAQAASALGAVALSLCGVALYALVAWFVVMRRREIGVRMALGASPAQVRRLVIGQAIRSAWPGAALGILLALALAAVTRSALAGVDPMDPVALAVGVGGIVLVILTAAYGPSRAATRVVPSEALRQ
jgi:putative ABC transport system permease protein